MPSSFFYSRELDKPFIDKRAITERNEEAVAEFLARGNRIRTVRSRGRSRYVNPVPLSPVTRARCQLTAVHRAEAKRVANLFPSSIDPGVARALDRGSVMRRRRTPHLNVSKSV
jgi:hypothetical protein